MAIFGGGKNKPPPPPSKPPKNTKPKSGKPLGQGR